MNDKIIYDFIRQIITDFNQVFRQIAHQQTKALELSGFLGVHEHYKINGYSVKFINPENYQNSIVVKTSTRGHPANYTRIFAEKNKYKVEIHMNLMARSAHDSGIYCVDVGVIPEGIIPIKINKGEKWSCIENDNLITFAEVKKLVIYPMLIAQFIGIVHEIKPDFLGGKLKRNFLSNKHFLPSLISLGNFSGNSSSIVKNFQNRKFKINIINNYDQRIAMLRGGKNKSPLDDKFFVE